MILDEAIDMIRSAAQRQAVPRGKSRKRNLWDTVIAQIAERDSFDGECFDTFVDLIRDLCPHLAEARPAQLKLWQSPFQKLDTLAICQQDFLDTQPRPAQIRRAHLAIARGNRKW